MSLSQVLGSCTTDLEWSVLARVLNPQVMQVLGGVIHRVYDCLNKCVHEFRAWCAWLGLVGVSDIVNVRAGTSSTSTVETGEEKLDVFVLQQKTQLLYPPFIVC